MRKILSRLGILLFALVLLTVFLGGILFHSRNNNPIDIDLYFQTITAPVSYLVVGSMIVGACLGWLAALAPLFVMQGRLYQLRRRQRMTEQELEALRTLPFRDAE